MIKGKEKGTMEKWFVEQLVSRSGGLGGPYCRVIEKKREIE